MNFIVGGAGNDTIIGGLGWELMVGGAGSDTFVFRSLDEISSAVFQVGPGIYLASNVDQIADFVSGTDKIDLSQIDMDPATNGIQHLTWTSSPGTVGNSVGPVLANGTVALGIFVDANASPEFVLVAGTVAQGDVILA